MSQKLNRTNETNINKFENRMVIIKYINNQNITVKFLDYDYKVNTTYNRFKNGSVYSPYDKSVLNIGYLGEGKYNTSINGKSSMVYIRWRSMLKRCYDEKDRLKNPTYRDCTVCDEWLCFQTFAQWFDDNYYEIGEEQMQLDKDILVKGNKVYSPDTCVFVPQRINYLFTKNNKKRGDLPIGVFYDNNINKYIASYNKFKKHVHIGCYNDPTEAFESYKKVKEIYIKQIANYYKEKIPDKLYKAMYKYIVEIND